MNTAIDLAIIIAIESSLGENATWVVTEMRIDVLKPIPEGKLLAVGKVVAVYDMSAIVECMVTDDEDHPIAKATSAHSAYRES